MAEYRAVVQRRIRILVVCAVIALVFIGTVGVWGYLRSLNSDAHMRDFATGMAVGMFCALAAVMLVGIFQYWRALKDESKLRKLYIEEHDERTKLIMSKTGGLAYGFALSVVAVAGIGLSLVDEKIGFTLMAVAVFMSMHRLALKIYYGKKI